jgi:hypothetical protein
MTLFNTNCKIGWDFKRRNVEPGYGGRKTKTFQICTDQRAGSKPTKASAVFERAVLEKG